MGEMFESKIGKYFIILYALFALSVYAYVLYCNQLYCAAYIILPVMPWAYVLVKEVGVTFSWALYPIFFLLNASASYILGATIEWVYNRYLDHKEEKKLKGTFIQKKSDFRNS